MIFCRARMAKHCFKPISSLLASNNYLHMADHGGTRVMHLQKLPPAPRSAEHIAACRSQKADGLWLQCARACSHQSQPFAPRSKALNVATHLCIMARRGIKRSCLFTAQSNTKTSPFPSLRVHLKHEGTKITCKPNCAPGGTLSKTRLASCCGGILAGSTARILAGRSGSIGRILGRIHRQGVLGGIHWRAALAGYWAGPTGQLRRDPLASRSGGTLGGIHWQAALAGYWAGSTGQLLWRILSGIH